MTVGLDARVNLGYGGGIDGGWKVERVVPIVPSAGWKLIPASLIVMLLSVIVVPAGSCKRVSISAAAAGIVW